MGLVESGKLPKPLTSLLNTARKYSLWAYQWGLACCAIEMGAAFASPRYDVMRLGVIPLPASPRQADVVVISGTVTDKMVPAIKRLYEQMADPKYVISMGACTNCGGGRFSLVHRGTPRTSSPPRGLEPLQRISHDRDLIERLRYLGAHLGEISLASRGGVVGGAHGLQLGVQPAYQPRVLGGDQHPSGTASARQEKHWEADDKVRTVAAPLGRESRTTRGARISAS